MGVADGSTVHADAEVRDGSALAGTGQHHRVDTELFSGLALGHQPSHRSLSSFTSSAPGGTSGYFGPSFLDVPRVADFFDQVLYRRRDRPLVRPRRPAVMAAPTSSTGMAPRPYSLRCASPLRVRQDRPVSSGHGGSAPPVQGRPLKLFIRTILDCVNENCFRVTPLRSQSVRR